MSENHRTVFILRNVHGYSIREIAKMMNSAESTTRLRLYYARRFFKRMLRTHLQLADEFRRESRIFFDAVLHGRLRKARARTRRFPGSMPPHKTRPIAPILSQTAG